MNKITQSISNLLVWFDTMNTNDGIAGPVSHYWGNCFDYIGPGFDWRYEGYFIALSEIYKKNKSQDILAKLYKAWNDVKKAQYENGALRCSHFQANPINYGTPHEPALFHGLCHFSDILKYIDKDSFEEIKSFIKKYLDNFLFKYLWNPTYGAFNDWPFSVRDLVTPNKNATILELLVDCVDIFSKDYTDYILKTTDFLLKCQELDKNSPVYGGIFQTYNKYQDMYFPYYNARCILGLNSANKILNKDKIKTQTLLIADFIKRNMDNSGFSSQIVKKNGDVISTPKWIAGAGDILDVLYDFDKEKIKKLFLDNYLPLQMCSGAFSTSIDDNNIPDFESVLPVAGWNDKMLRFLARLLPEQALLSKAEISDFNKKVKWRNKIWNYKEDNSKIALIQERIGAAINFGKDKNWTEVPEELIETFYY